MYILNLFPSIISSATAAYVGIMFNGAAALHHDCTAVVVANYPMVAFTTTDLCVNVMVDDTDALFGNPLTMEGDCTTEQAYFCKYNYHENSRVFITKEDTLLSQADAAAKCEMLGGNLKSIVGYKSQAIIADIIGSR